MSHSLLAELQPAVGLALTLADGDAVDDTFGDPDLFAEDAHGQCGEGCLSGGLDDDGAACRECWG